MDRYQKVEKPREVTPIDENEIRITSQGRMRSYITYAMTLLQEKGADEIVFKAMGRAINKTVTMVELIKRRIVGLHQLTTITSTGITDTYEPLEEGLLPLESTRHVSMITISLSKKELDTKAVGYQPPIPADQVKVFTEIEYEGEGSPNMRGRGQGGRGRGRSRAQYGNGYMGGEYEDGGYDRPRNYGRGRGRGRGRYFRGGRGRGGGGGNFNSQYDSTMQDGGYHQEAPPGRGRGRAGYNNSQYGSSPQQDFGYHDNRGRGRGGYNNSQYDDQHDGGYYHDAPPVRGRGRGGYNNSHYDAPQDGGYNPDAHAQGRGGRGRGGAGYNNTQYDAPQDGGRGRGGRFRGPSRGRGRGGGGGNYRSNNNGPMPHSADA
ncbi:unnamed protein product [Cuscuta campestris]|uniref:DNA/RNA-binding protein Alba-like domain-containing protein n=1 Tax=Cuscuta campestris TaxID=132261 RepID=A0A484KE91_9ASTE|nr:unnamed protein product [Cuscuta campestris]